MARSRGQISSSRYYGKSTQRIWHHMFDFVTTRKSRILSKSCLRQNKNNNKCTASETDEMKMAQ